jgi:hypothetical protein
MGDKAIERADGKGVDRGTGKGRECDCPCDLESVYRPVSSIVNNGDGTATVTVPTGHALPNIPHAAYYAPRNNVFICGADQPQYNGYFDVYQYISTTQFKISGIATSVPTPATGTIFLQRQSWLLNIPKFTVRNTYPYYSDYECFQLYNLGPWIPFHYAAILQGISPSTGRRSILGTDCDESGGEAEDAYTDYYGPSVEGVFRLSQATVWNIGCSEGYIGIPSKYLWTAPRWSNYGNQGPTSWTFATTYIYNGQTYTSESSGAISVSLTYFINSYENPIVIYRSIGVSAGATVFTATDTPADLITPVTLANQIGSSCWEYGSGGTVTLIPCPA